MIEILYEDNHILVVEKKENIPSQKDSSNDLDMVTLLKDYLKEKYQKTGNVYLGLVHRLDRPVGGVMVFAKTSKAAKRLSEDIKNNLFHKKYLAVVEGTFKSQKGCYIDKILRLSNGNSTIDEKGNSAKLYYEVVQAKENKSLVNIDLITGRHHQIRVQFKYHNHPLCGDQRYNKQDKSQIALYSYYLEFIHPVKKQTMRFIKMPKEYGYFKEFKKEIKQLNEKYVY